MEISGTQMEKIIKNLEETCEAGKPVLEDFAENWKQHDSFLQMMRFMLSISEDTGQKQMFLQEIDSMRKDVVSLFAMCGSYHGLGIALKSILKDGKDEQQL